MAGPGRMARRKIPSRTPRKSISSISVTIRDPGNTFFTAATQSIAIGILLGMPLLETSAASDPHLPWRFLLCGAGTAVSHRTRPRAPNSFNVLELEPDAPTIALVRYDWTDGRFGVRETQRFARGPAGWDRR